MVTGLATPLVLRSVARGAGASASVAIAVSAVIALVALASFIVWLYVWAVRQSQLRGDAGDGDVDGGDGGGGQRRNPPSPTGPAGGDPAWWPDFERQFASYVAGRRAQQEALVPAGSHERRGPTWSPGQLTSTRSRA